MWRIHHGSVLLRECCLVIRRKGATGGSFTLGILAKVKPSLHCLQACARHLLIGMFIMLVC